MEQVILPPVRDLGADFKVRRALPSAHRRMVGPFIFLDHFGPMVFRAGAGPNIRPHPHIRLSTLTYLLEGGMVHRDSVGNVEMIRAGDVNWMTGGRAGETEFVPLPPDPPPVVRTDGEPLSNRKD